VGAVAISRAVVAENLENANSGIARAGIGGGLNGGCFRESIVSKCGINRDRGVTKRRYFPRIT